MKFHYLLIALLITFSVSIANAEDKKDSYKSATDNSGTTVTTETKHDNSVASDGSKTLTEEVKTVIDPKGILNEKTAKSTIERDVKPNGDYEASHTVQHANGTEERVSVEKKTSKHWLGKGNTTTTTEERVVDPRGLGNKHTVELQEKVVSNPEGSEKITTTKKIDGEVVSDKTNIKPHS